jgi:hypothetical protein
MPPGAPFQAGRVKLAVTLESMAILEVSVLLVGEFSRVSGKVAVKSQLS